REPVHGDDGQVPARPRGDRLHAAGVRRGHRDRVRGVVLRVGGRPARLRGPLRVVRRDRPGRRRARRPLTPTRSRPTPTSRTACTLLRYALLGGPGRVTRGPAGRGNATEPRGGPMPIWSITVALAADSVEKPASAATWRLEDIYPSVEAFDAAKTKVAAD